MKLIEIALANNRDLRVAALNVERARAQFQIQRADQWPTVNATAQGVSQRSSGALTPTGNGFRLEYFQSALGVTAYELDFFGRVRSLSDSALAQYLSTDEAAKSVHRDADSHHTTSRKRRRTIDWLVESHASHLRHPRGQIASSLGTT